MGFSLVLLNQDIPGISVVTLNRPEKRNAFNASLLRELITLLEKISTDSTQRFVILKGEGPFFCAGMDLAHVEEDFRELIPKALKGLYKLPQVTCAIVQGGAIAGGTGIIACCDYVIAEERAKFGCPETRRGFVAATIMPLLIRKIGPGNTRKLLLRADLISSQKALEIGLIDKIAAQEKLLDESLELAKDILQGAPQATRYTKELLNDLYPTTIDDDLNRAEKYAPYSIPQEEPQEGIAAFLEKRKPKWRT